MQAPLRHLSHFPEQPPRPANPFSSFWMGGYECTDQLNCFGHRVDLLRTTGHLDRAADDYALLQPYGIRTVREGIRWSVVERVPRQYDFSAVAELLEAGQASGVQQVWDLCHFGYPDDLTPLHPLFAQRFAALCRAFVRFYRDRVPDGPLVVTPINEVSFISWLGGDARGTSPYCIGQGWEVKYALMRAYIEGVAALREEDPTIRIMTTEPLVNVIPPLDPTPADREAAARAHADQYQATDMLCGRMCPELGGRPEFLDIMGVNYYYNNQWVVGTGQFLPWVNDAADPRWKPLATLLHEAYDRYRRPMVLSETSHPGADRPHWMRFVGTECAAALRAGIPLWGACLYPIIDRPDWDHGHQWHQAGLWDATPETGAVERTLCEPYAEALLHMQDLIAGLSTEHVPHAERALFFQS